MAHQFKSNIIKQCSTFLTLQNTKQDFNNNFGKTEIYPTQKTNLK